ncbi:cytochrome bd-I oxidase subunit CydX [Enterobacteriaceae endosymbiont of Donacia tomentosa]|nr:cytochrome bd-I oxidase subunit CydX [Enterobacteriaceae endosymbiont of Donacia tomentosa]QJC31645.1 cytochrome bd-I oxidase subunit CydX [Enterobacteriaceae endosymbiont of Donacia tomentosa]
MWYFIWLLGVIFTCIFSILITLKKEYKNNK